MPQLETIIKAMFSQNNKASDPTNWKLNFNSIVGGQGYQHPHCDIGRPGSFKDLDIFPFVGLHGFGLNEFSLWLLPPKSDYGFLHMFESYQMVFLRGDQVHAGPASPIPRGHMEFLPLPGAGYQRRNPFWCRAGYAQVTFPYQDPYRFPFGYPEIGTPNAKGEQILTYPVEVTRLLQLPLDKNEPCTKDEKRARTAMKKRLSAQLNLF